MEKEQDETIQKSTTSQNYNITQTNDRSVRVRKIRPVLKFEFICNTVVWTKPTLPSVSTFFLSAPQTEPLGRDPLEQVAQGFFRHLFSISKDGNPTTSLINLLQYFTTTFSVPSPQNNAIYS